MVKQEKNNENCVLIASTNAGKIALYSQIFDELGIKHCSLRDLKVDIQVEETGKNEIENATLKAKAYHEATGLPVLSNDSGLVVEKFDEQNQPGVLVRRYSGRELTDEEMIKIYSQKLEEVGGESKAHFNVALVICDKDGNYHSKLFRSERYFVSKPSSVVCKGLPLRSLEFVKKYGKYMSELSMVEQIACEGDSTKLQKEFIRECFSKI